MRYWWVNQNQTFRHELEGGYLWSPKANRNGRVNPFYEFMKEVAPGDAIFSFFDTKIPAIGIAMSNAYEAPKPLEFGVVGAYWDQIGWRVNVRFTRLQNGIRPSEHMQRLRPYLPPKYSPLQANGDGMQAVYLTALGERLALQLVDIIGTEAHSVVRSWQAQELSQEPLPGQAEWEEHQIEQVRLAVEGETERRALVLSRLGQGLFRARVAAIEKRCRVTGVSQLEYLRASHTKPWRDATNEERLDGENGLLLTPDIDHLFDRGFISFESSGKVLVSPVANTAAMQKMGITRDMLQNVGAFSTGQRQYLEWHRENIFLEARVRPAHE